MYIAIEKGFKSPTTLLHFGCVLKWQRGQIVNLLSIDFGGSSPSATICHLSTAAVHRICNARVMSSNLIGGFHGPIV